MSQNNLKQIVLATIKYADEHEGRLPPAVLRDQERKPLHSWRVLILPYLEQQALYDQFRLDEPWDSPHNLALVPNIPKVYAPLSNLPVEMGTDPHTTFYQVFVGKGTAFEGPQGLLYPHDFRDGTSQTIFVVEAGKPVPWTKPVDLDYDDDRPLPALGGIFTGESRFSIFGSKNRVKGMQAALGDGSVKFVYSTVSEATLRAAITRNEGRELGYDW